MGALNPWLIVAALVAAISLSGVGYLKGRSDGAARCDARIAEIQAASAKEKQNEADKATEAAGKLEGKREDAKVIYRTITNTVDKIVEKPVYRDRCIDDDGLRAINQALAGPAAAAAKPDPPMPRSLAPQ